MSREAFVNGFVWIAALTQVQYAVQDLSTSESPMIFHHERGAPIHPRVVNASFKYMFVSWKSPNDTQEDLNNYVINYYRSRDFSYVKRHQQKILPSNGTSAYLKGLDPGTNYSFFVVANYSTGHLPKSSTITRQLPGYGADNMCHCNFTGTNLTELDNCEPRHGQCACKNEYTNGRKCDSCRKDSYWHNKLGCQQCRCPDDKTSDGTCYLDEKGLVMCHCLYHHAGRKCLGCLNSFYLVGGKECQPCDCSGNENKTLGSKICDGTTGECLACGYNTTGPKCNQCKPGFAGVALMKNCTYDLHVPYGESVEEVNHNLVIGLTLGVVSILIVLTVVLVYIKCKQQNKPFNFWTVQLDDDHENVNFSSMMEHDFPYTSNGRPNGPNSSRNTSRDKVSRTTSSDGNLYLPVKT